jgi:hypothetical protein
VRTTQITRSPCLCYAGDDEEHRSFGGNHTGVRYSTLFDTAPTRGNRRE